jgi:RNA polymerase sigma-70 factor (ECF subfamily)
VKTSRIEEMLTEDGWMRHLARHLTADPETADDLVQETWLSLLRKPPAGRRSPRAWIYTVMLNLSRNRHRGSTRRQTREREWAQIQPAPDHETVEREHAEAVLNLRRALVSLPSAYREVVYLRYFCHLEPAEIAEDQGVPAATVRTRVRRALASLRKQLDEQHGNQRAAWSAALGVWARSHDGMLPGSPGSPAETFRSALRVPASVRNLTVGGLTLAAGIVTVTMLVDSDEAESALPAETVQSVATTPAGADIQPIASETERLMGAALPSGASVDAPATDAPSASALPATDGLFVRVVDADTRRPLDNARVLVLFPGLPPLLHPGSPDRFQELESDGSATVRIDPLVVMDFERVQKTAIFIYASAPGYAWGRKSLVPDATGIVEVGVRLGGSLDIELIGSSIDTEVFLKLSAQENRAAVVNQGLRLESGTWRGSWDGLPPGEYRLAALCGHVPPIVLGETTLELMPGGLPRVVLSLVKSALSVAPVALTGTLTMQSDLLFEPTLSLTALDGPAVHSESSPAVQIQTPTFLTDGLSLYAWTVELLLPGEYEVVVEPYGFRREFTVQPSGSPAVELVMPALARVEVDVVDAETGQPVDVKKVHWSRSSGPSLEWDKKVRRGEIRPGGPGQFTIDCVPGQVRISSRLGASKRGNPNSGHVYHEATPGTSHVVLPVRLRETMTVRLIEAGVRVPYDPMVHGLSIERVDGRDVDIVDALNRRGFVFVGEPGLYRLTLRMVKGFEPTLPQLVTLRRGVEEAVEFRLIRR